MPQKGIPAGMYGVCVRERENDRLFLLRRIKVDPENICLPPPSDNGEVKTIHGKRKSRNSHITLHHVSGRRHIKSFDKPYLGRDVSTKGIVEVGTEPITANQLRSIKSMQWKKEGLTQLFEIPISELNLEKYPTNIAVHLAEPEIRPEFPSDFHVIWQRVIKDGNHWIWVSITEDTGWSDPSLLIPQDAGYSQWLRAIHDQRGGQ